MGDRLLAGTRVIEFSRLIAAPFCGLTLQDHGAEVIKVESPGGDDSRTFPPFLEDGQSGFFHALNRGKRGIVLDLSEERSRELAQRLVATADVVVDNLGASSARLGFGYEEAAAANERLVWCSVTGMGAGRGGRAMDPSLQASMGMMALTGESGGPPLRVPVPLVDFMTGMYAAQSVLAALWAVERGGRGAFLDCAMVDSAATLTSIAALLALDGTELPRIGSQSYLAAPSAVFATADGEYVQLVAASERQWQALCRGLDRPKWIDDPLCADAATRLENRNLVHGRIQEVVAKATATEVVERVSSAGGLCERVRGLGEAWRDPLLGERGLTGRLDVAGHPFPVVSLARAGVETLGRGPSLGEHTDAVIGELGD